jgi:hypothetical protein
MYKYDEDGDFYTESGSVASPEGVEREFLDCDDILEKLNKLVDCELRLAEAYEYIQSTGSFMSVDGKDWTDEKGEEMIKWVNDRK